MKRYVLSVLVENHAGVLSRVSGLFSRRGYNIDSLTVGETFNPEQSRMTIVVRLSKTQGKQIMYKCQNKYKFGSKVIIPNLP